MQLFKKRENRNAPPSLKKAKLPLYKKKVTVFKDAKKRLYLDVMSTKATKLSLQLFIQAK